MGYAFISYSTKNQSSADAIRSLFKKNNIDTWMAPYNIPAGSEYAEVLYDALNNCSCFVLLLTNDSQNSQWVRKEVNIAVSNGKSVIPVKLEDVELNSSMKLYLNDQQIVPVKVLDDTNEDVMRIIASVSALVKTDPAVPPTAKNETHETTPITKETPSKPLNNGTAQKKSKKLIIAAIAAVALIAIALGAFFAFSGRDDSDEPKETDGNPQVTETGKPEDTTPDLPVEMSDTLSDFTFELEGVIYQLPCDFSKFTENGWTISSTGTSSDALVPGEEDHSIQLSKDGKKFYANLYNYSGNAKKAKDCKIGLVEFQTNYGVDAKIAKDFTTTATVEEIQEAFGIPSNTNEYSSSVTLTYSFNDSYTSYVQFYIDSDTRYSTITLKNYVKTEDDKTETNKEAPLYLNDYKAPAELGNDPTSFRFELDGKTYQLPCPVNAFLDDGWTFSTQPGYVVSGGYNYVTLKKDGKEIVAHIKNLAEYQTIPTNCIVFEFSVYSSDKLDIALPGLTSKITLGMTADALKAQLSTDFTEYEGAFGLSYSYSTYDLTSIFFTISNETGLFDAFTISYPPETPFYISNPSESPFYIHPQS